MTVANLFSPAAHRGQAIGPEGLVASWILIDKQLALELLQSSKGNRGAKREKFGGAEIVTSNVASLVEEKRSGRWIDRVSGVMYIDENGTLIDGHTRCAAIVETEIPQWQLVVFGVKDSDFLAIDAHSARTSLQQMRRASVPHPGDVAATLRTYIRMVRTRGRLVGRGSGGTTIAVKATQVMEEYERLGRPDDVIRLARRIDPRAGVGRASLGAFVLATRKSDYHEDALAFVEQLNAPRNAVIDQQVAVLLDRLNDNRRKNALNRMGTEVTLAWLIKAYNAWITAKEIKQLKWTMSMEYPLIFGVDYEAL